jgi:hypothetical protein
MPRSRWNFLIALALLIAANAYGTFVQRFSPQRAATTAGVVFAGTVQSMQPVRLPTTILTKVVFTDLKFAKGAARSRSITLTLAGGQVDNDMIIADGQASFSEGERYIVFAFSDLGSEANSYLPVVGLYQGYFKVERGTSPGKGRVKDSTGHMLTEIAPDHVTTVLPDSLLPDALRNEIKSNPSTLNNSKRSRRVVLESSDPGTRVTEEQFLHAVMQFPK